MTTATRTADFIGGLGINTHIDFNNYGYQNLAVVESSIDYLGLKNLRDSPQSPADAKSWLQVAQATGAKFDAFLPEGSPVRVDASLVLLPQLASEGILNYVEGGNEEDDAYAAALGNSLPIAALVQQQVYQLGRSLGLPVINMSFGAGWTPANNYRGDYGSVGDLSAYSDFANAHTYQVIGQTPDGALQRLNGLAALAASAPVITTEVGWNRSQGFSEESVAKYVLDVALDGVKDGDIKTYFYALFDDGSGLFGLMNHDGTPMPAGQALHNLTILLADPGESAATFSTGSLAYNLTQTAGHDHSLLFQKSDGTYWIALWDETDRPHQVGVTLPSAAADIQVFDPLTGTSAVQDVKDASSVTVSLGDTPLLIEVTPTSSTVQASDSSYEMEWTSPSTGDTGTWITDAVGNIVGLHDLGSADTRYSAIGSGAFDSSGNESVLWEDKTTGDTGTWITDAGGNVVGFHDLGSADPSFSAVGIGDFDGSGRDTPMWENKVTGDTGYWTTDAAGDVTGFHDLGLANTRYGAVGIGDFDGSGRDTLMWENKVTGDTGYWTTDAAGDVTGFHDLGLANTRYGVVGVGDFDGRGRDTLLWENTATGDLGYWQTDNHGAVTGFFDFGGVDTAYSIIAVGDFDRSGHAGLLWENRATGDTRYWAISAGGALAGSHDLATVDTTYNLIAP